MDRHTGRDVEQRLAGRPGAARARRLIVAHWQGTLTVWSFTRPGLLSDTVRDALTDLLELVMSPTPQQDPPVARERRR